MPSTWTTGLLVGSLGAAILGLALVWALLLALALAWQVYLDLSA